MPVLHLDAIQATEHHTKFPSKIYPPNYRELRNLNLTMDGVFATRFGYENLNTNASPNAGTGQITAVAPAGMESASSVLYDGYCIGGPTTGSDNATIYWMGLRNDDWTSAGITTATNTYPWQYAWGYNSARTPGVILSPVGDSGGGKIYFGASLGTVTQLGSVSDASNLWTTGRCAEYFLNRGWIGAPDGVNDRVYYSITGNLNNYYGIGSGYLELFPPGGAFIDLTGMCIYRNRLFFACSTTLMVLTGTTERTFGTQYVHRVNVINGATMLSSENLMFYQDLDGIWIFNGATPVNIGLLDQANIWDDLSQLDKVQASACIDKMQGIYRIFFPAANQIWEYWYRKKRWVINVPAFTTDVIRVIGPIGPQLEGPYANYPLGAATNGRVFINHSEQKTDVGTAIIPIIKTGDLMLGLLNEKPGYEATVTDIWVLAIPDSSTDYTVTLDMDVDGTALTQQTKTVTSGSSGVPTRFRMPLPERTNALVHTFDFQMPTSGVIANVTDIFIEYELEKR